MKKLSSILMAMLFVASMSLFTSCFDEEGDPALNITVSLQGTVDDYSFAPNSAVNYDVTILSTEDVESYEVSAEASTGGSAETLTNELTEENDSTYKHSYSYTIPEGAEDDEEISITFTVTNSEGTSEFTKKTFNVVAGPGYSEYTDVMMKAQDSGNKMLLDAETGEVYSPDDIADGTVEAGAIDLVYIYQDNDDVKHGFYSPDDDYIETMGETYGSWNWSGTHNGTSVAECGQDYADIDETALSDLSVSGSYVRTLAEGDNVKFETVSGSTGVINIKSITLQSELKSVTTPNSVERDDEIVFDMKVLPASTTK